MNDLFFNGAKRLVKGAKNLDGVLICIKIGYITQSNQPTGTEMQIKFRGIWKIGGHTATTTWKTVNVSTTY